jgi:hypothetical protein
VLKLSGILCCLPINVASLCLIEICLQDFCKQVNNIIFTDLSSFLFSERVAVITGLYIFYFLLHFVSY